MQRTLTHAKIHRATVTRPDLHHVGSLTIDSDLMGAADIMENEKVQVFDVTNGARLETFVAGNLANAIRSRYTPDEVDVLRTARWWCDWPIDVVSRHLSELVLGTPVGVLAVARAERLVDEPGRPAQDGGS
jgi:hypothetical protein